MRRMCIWLTGIAMILLGTVPGYGQSVADIDLDEWAFNNNGTVYDGITGPPSQGLEDNGFNYDTGIGTLVWTITTLTDITSYYLIAFLDHELDEDENVFYNESGQTTNSLAVGQSWEIDEPGYRNTATPGDIYDHLLAGNLDNAVGLTQGSSKPETYTAPDDVSMALGWKFALKKDETATIKFLTAETAPSSGFYLTQSDTDSQAKIYFSSTLEITGGGVPPSGQVPEPATMILLGSGLLGAAGFGRRRRPA